MEIEDKSVMRQKLDRSQHQPRIDQHFEQRDHRNITMFDAQTGFFEGAKPGYPNSKPTLKLDPIIRPKELSK